MVYNQFGFGADTDLSRGRRDPTTTAFDCIWMGVHVGTYLTAGPQNRSRPFRNPLVLKVARAAVTSYPTLWQECVPLHLYQNTGDRRCVYAELVEGMLMEANCCNVRQKKHFCFQLFFSFNYPWDLPFLTN